MCGYFIKGKGLKSLPYWYSFNRCQRAIDTQSEKMSFYLHSEESELQTHRHSKKHAKALINALKL